MNDWQSSFGAVSSQIASAAIGWPEPNISVPEPTSAVILMRAMTIMLTSLGRPYQKACVNLRETQ
ncbi:MAG: hypothetical protein ABGX16_09085 [Pirellulales bacterium]